MAEMRSLAKLCKDAAAITAVNSPASTFLIPVAVECPTLAEKHAGKIEPGPVNCETTCVDS